MHYVNFIYIYNKQSCLLAWAPFLRRLARHNYRKLQWTPWNVSQYIHGKSIFFSKQSSVATLGVLTVIVKAWCSSRWFHTCAAFLVILIQISKEVSHTTWSWHPCRQKLPHRPFLTEISIEMASPDVTLGLSDCSQWHGANSALARATPLVFEPARSLLFWPGANFALARATLGLSDRSRCFVTSSYLRLAELLNVNLWKL